MAKTVPTRVQATQNLRRSGAYGSHRGPQDRPRAERERDALSEQYDLLEERYA